MRALGRAGGVDALVNDLDLNISVVEMKQQEGEGAGSLEGVILKSKGQFRTNDPAGGTHPEPRRDNTNNVERVVIPADWASTMGVTADHGLSILVAADRVVGAKGQAYALVVVGPEGLQVSDLGARSLLSASRALSVPWGGLIAAMTLQLVRPLVLLS